MKIDDMIAVLEAAKRGEKIEFSNTTNGFWLPHETPVWKFDTYDYRIAPKPQMTLVEELRLADRHRRHMEDLFRRAADRIEELTKINHVGLGYATTDELLAELKRRTEC